MQGLPAMAYSTLESPEPDDTPNQFRDRSYRAFPGQDRGRALAARNRGVTPRLPRLEGRAQGTGGPPGPSGFHP